MNIPKLLIFLFLLGLSVYSAYMPWFHPEEYLHKIKKQRQHIKKGYTRFLPQVGSFEYFNRHPRLDLWSARLSSTLIILICIVAVLAVLAGGQ